MSNDCYDQVRRNSCYDEAGCNSCYDKAGLDSCYNKAGRTSYYDEAGCIGILLRILLPKALFLNCDQCFENFFSSFIFLMMMIKGGLLGLKSVLLVLGAILV